ncbi:MAG: MetQ/NlpA family ABC transporter substrate-binding protein [Bacillota bacterium]|nr:MetQ/NlpA family ABC transporter substrate-binding protein [Bacillota bacterium]
MTERVAAADGLCSRFREALPRAGRAVGAGRWAAGILLPLALLAAACGGTGGTGTAAQESGTKAAGQATTLLKVGATAVPHAEILEQVVKPILARQGIRLQVVEFSDYTQINPALKDGSLDANYFQHIPYLDDWNAHNGGGLVAIAKVHIEPMGLYSNRITSLAQLKDGATIAIPDDTTNGGRALLLLQSAGLIRLRPGAGYTATLADVAANPHRYQIRELAAEIIPRALDDVDLAAINTNYVLEARKAGLLKHPAPLYLEEADSPFANVLVVRRDEVGKPAVEALARALVGPQVKAFIESHYKGAVVPAQQLLH